LETSEINNGHIEFTREIEYKFTRASDSEQVQWASTSFSEILANPERFKNTYVLVELSGVVKTKDGNAYRLPKPDERNQKSRSVVGNLAFEKKGEHTVAVVADQNGIEHRFDVQIFEDRDNRGLAKVYTTHQVNFGLDQVSTEFYNLRKPTNILHAPAWSKPSTLHSVVDAAHAAMTPGDTDKILELWMNANPNSNWFQQQQDRPGNLLKTNGIKYLQDDVPQKQGPILLLTPANLRSLPDGTPVWGLDGVQRRKSDRLDLDTRMGVTYYGVRPTGFNELGDIITFMDQGVSKVMTESDYTKFASGKPVVGRSQGHFVTTTREMDLIMEKVGHDPYKVAEALGLGELKNGSLIRIDIPNPWNLNPRLPTRELGGANDFFIEGGRTSGGVYELIIDSAPAHQVQASVVRVGADSVIQVRPYQRMPMNFNTGIHLVQQTVDINLSLHEDSLPHVQLARQILMHAERVDEVAIGQLKKELKNSSQGDFQAEIEKKRILLKDLAPNRAAGEGNSRAVWISGEGGNGFSAGQWAQHLQKTQVNLLEIRQMLAGDLKMGAALSARSVLADLAGEMQNSFHLQEIQIKALEEASRVLVASPQSVMKEFKGVNELLRIPVTVEWNDQPRNLVIEVPIAIRVQLENRIETAQKVTQAGLADALDLSRKQVLLAQELIDLRDLLAEVIAESQTGNQSVKQFNELKEKIQSLGEDIKAIYQVAQPGYLLDFEGQNCTGSCLALGYLLEQQGIQTTRMHTIEPVGPTSYFHNYLRMDDYFGPDKHLYIDPTIRGYFAGKPVSLPREQLDQIPMIFVGTREEMAALFKKFLPENLQRYPWEETYFDAVDVQRQVHPNPQLQYTHDFERLFREDIRQNEGTPRPQS
jgi:hypothetical protein